MKFLTLLLFLPRLKPFRLFIPAPLRQLPSSARAQLAMDCLPLDLPPVALSLPDLAHLLTVGPLVLSSRVLATEYPRGCLVLSAFSLRPCWYNHGKITMQCSLCIFVNFMQLKKNVLPSLHVKTFSNAL